MRKSRLLLFALLLCVCLSVVSSPLCYASPVEDNGYFYDNYSEDNAGSFESELEFHSVNANTEPIMKFALNNDSVANNEVIVRDHFLMYDRGEGSYFEYYKHDFTPTNKKFSNYTFTEITLPYLDNQHLFSRYWDIYMSNGDVMIEKGDSVDIHFSFFGSQIRVTKISDGSKYMDYTTKGWDSVSWWYNIYYSDGSVDTIYNDTLNHSTNTFSVSITEARKNVCSVVIHCSGDFDNLFPVLERDGYYDTDKFTIEFMQGCYNGEFFAKVYDKNTGLLSGLLGWVKNIAATVKSIPEKIGNIVSSIAELPQKLWSAISDGLKALFVPTEEKIEEFKTNFEGLFEERFGALYESGSYLTDFFEEIGQVSAKEYIFFPKCTVNLVGVDFTFGGYSFEMIPKKFEFLLDMLKSLISIICTIAFINAMKKRFEGILGGENTSV